MTEYTSFSDSYAATDTLGNLIFFTVLVNVGEDSRKAAAKVARQNKWKKVLSYNVALLFG